MLAFFTTGKPFHGHTAIIQRNALKSWMLLGPDVEVILFGDDKGAQEIARELGIRHEAHAEKNASGSIRMDTMFLRAQKIARHEVLCYSNCDIVLMRDFCQALGRVKAERSQFLMVGRRWDAKIKKSLEFGRSDWEEQLRGAVLREAHQQSPDCIDYFVFSRGILPTDLPPLVVGRAFWDNWLVWKILQAKHPVVDVSAAVMAVHQSHDYGHVPKGKQTVYYGEEAGRNYELAGGWKHLRTIADAKEVLTEVGLKPNTWRYCAAMKRYLRQAWRLLVYEAIQPLWFLFLGITRPARRVLGLQSATLRRVRAKGQLRGGVHE